MTIRLHRGNPLRSLILAIHFVLLLVLIFLSPIQAASKRKLAKAERYLKEGNFVKASQIASEITQKNPQELDAYTIQIQSLVAQKKYTAAEHVYDELLVATNLDYPPALSSFAWGIFIQAFTDKSFFVRGIVADVLSEVGDVRASKPLRLFLKDEFDVVRVHAIESMAKLKLKKGIEFLTPLVKDKSYLVRTVAVETLYRLGETTYLSVLFEDLKNESFNVCARAAEILGKLKDPQSIPQLKKALNDTNASVQVRVAGALASCGDTDVKNILVSFAHKGEWPDRVHACEFLTALGEEKVALEVLNLALQQSDWKLRVQASDALGNSLVQAALPTLEKKLKDDRWEVRFAVAQAMVRLGDLSQVNVFRQLLEVDDGEVRANSAGKLGALGSDRDLANLRLCLKDVDGRVRVQAAKSIILIRSRAHP